jgi:preprotein translocase subunit SecE
MSEISWEEIKQIIWTERIKVSQIVSSILLLILGCTLIGNN